MNTPNHYHTLGIRPSASIEEIELAFKGRRSQYHPDRYSNAGSETIQWATVQMQQVNVAYRVLSDPTQRQIHDRALRQAEPPSQPNATNGKSERTGTGLTLRQHLTREFAQRVRFDRLYIAPDIPLKKLSGALTRYGSGLDAADVLALVDDTVFGGGGDGMLVTENAVYLKSLGEERQMVSIEAMQRVQSSENALYMNGRKLIQMNMPYVGGIDLLCELIRDYATAKYGTQQNEEQEEETADESETDEEDSDSDDEPTREELFAMAKQKFGELYRSLELGDSEGAKAFATLALNYFEETQTKISQRIFYIENYRELVMVYLLSRNIFEIIEEEGQIDPDLLEDNGEEEKLVHVLRTMLRKTNKGGDQDQAKQRADKYFREN